ncbi:MAG: IS5 family transposase [Myxococcales bacterium]|nr:IS5 family transposase [Myxococcales bacterium]
MSRGGRTTSLHARVDAQGRPLQIILSPGNIHDSICAQELLAEFAAGARLADKAYDTNSIIEHVEMSGAEVVISPKKNRTYFRENSKELYKERNWVERFFNRVKQYRGLATCYEKITESFLAMIYLFCIRVWLLRRQALDGYLLTHRDLEFFCCSLMLPI